MGEPPSTTAAATGPVVVVSDEQRDVGVDADRWAQLAAAVLRSERAIGELTLTFVDRAEIAELNAGYLGHEGPTDVLSFPLDGGGGGDSGLVAGVPVLLGDVVVCPAIAVEQAASHAGSVDDELALLVVHGVLHVLGHDHDAPDKAGRMRRLELELLEQHHWRGPAPSGFLQEHA